MRNTRHVCLHVAKQQSLQKDQLITIRYKNPDHITMKNKDIGQGKALRVLNSLK